MKISDIQDNIGIIHRYFHLYAAGAITSTNQNPVRIKTKESSFNIHLFQKPQYLKFERNQEEIIILIEISYRPFDAWTISQNSM